MITSSDSALILFDDCKRLFNFDTYLGGTEPKGDVKSKRIVIHGHKQTAEKIWKKNFVDVNLAVPDIDGEPDLVELQALERLAHEVFDDGVTGEFDGCGYYYSPESIGYEDDTSLKCHYVSVIILFEVLNVRK